MSKKLTLLAFLVTGSTLVSAQKDTLSGKSDDVIVTTATRSNLKQSQTGKIVTLIDRQTIQNNTGRNLSELLNTEAGFFINGANNTPGTNQDIYFRGAGTGNMLIVIDGIPVFDPSQINNSFDFNSIPLQEVDHIEILKGGQSTLWGSDAVAGVIQLFLKKEAKKAFTANTGISYGSYQTMRLHAGISGTVQKLGYQIQYNRTSSNGISAAYDSLQTGNFDKDGFAQNSVQASLRYQVAATLTASAFGNFSSYHTDYDAGAYTDDKDYTAHNKNDIGGFTLQYKGKTIVWNLLASYQQAKRNFTNDSNDISSIYSKYATGRYTGNTAILETFGNTRLSKNISLVSGIQYLKQNSDQYYFSTGSFGPNESGLSKDSAAIQQLSVYGSILITDQQQFNLELGGRYNHHSIYGNKGTFTFNPSYHLNRRTKLFLNISSAYKIPSLYQLYSNYRNKQLKPESSTTYELGIQQGSTSDRLYLRLAAFKRDASNLLIFYTDPVTYESRYVNGDKQNDYGFELESALTITGSASLHTNFSYVTGKGIVSGNKVSNLYRRPVVTASTGITLHPLTGLTLVTSARVVGSRLKGQYDIGPEKQPSYYTVDCFAAYQLQKNIRFFLDLHNLTNQQYFDIVGYTSKRFNAMAGIDIRF